MANEHNIKIYTAADIEKYVSGQLSPSEMHALEKAALEDPFLEDALEGYMNHRTEKDSMGILYEQLNERVSPPIAIEEAKIVAMQRSYRGLKIAAMIALLVVAGFMVYRFTGNNEKKIVADNIIKTEQAPVPKSDTLVAITSGNVMDTQVDKKVDAAITLHDKLIANTPSSFVNTDTSNTHYFTISPKNDDKQNVDKSTDQVALNKPSTTINADSTLGNNGRADYAMKEKNPYYNNASNASNFKKAAGPEVLMNNRSTNNALVSVAPNKIPTNLFRGHVTDAQHNALPFTNITNPIDNVGTYSDANGNFTITSPDSLLIVQVHAVGYENMVANLKPNQMITNNQVVMTEDNKSLQEVVISHQRVDTRRRSLNDSLVKEDAEPEDGWNNYQTYLANNITLNEDYLNKAGEVKVSFDVDKDGSPTNIRVDKSLCDSCDKEAVRLVKQGPKWKRKSKKKRTSVSVAF